MGLSCCCPGLSLNSRTLEQKLNDVLLHSNSSLLHGPETRPVSARVYLKSCLAILQGPRTRCAPGHRLADGWLKRKDGACP